MGRPPLNMKIATVRLPEETLKEIDALVGKHRRPTFIREAVERELKRVKAESAGRTKTGL